MEPKSNDLFETLFESAPDAILLVDRGGTIVRVNARTAALFERERTTLVGAKIESLVPQRFHAAHERHRTRFVANPRTRPMGEGMRLYARRGEDREFPVEIALAPVEVEGTTYVLCIVRDVTLRYETEENLQRAREDLEQRVAERTAELREANRRLVEEQAKLIQAEKLSSIGLLASGVAHEINNPLSGVTGILRAIEEDRLGDDERREFFESAREALERMRMTVQSLLNFTRHRKPERERLDVAEIAAACARLTSPAARRKGVQVAIDVLAGEAALFADRAQVMQALLNVVMNAIHAAPAGSTVRVSTVRRDGALELRVDDAGPGIPEAIRTKVTDPFFTTKPEGEGTGLGLAVTLGILDAHGARLAIDDREGGGASIRMIFPDADPADA